MSIESALFRLGGKTVKQRVRAVTAPALLLAALASPALADEPDIGSAIAAGKAKLDLRYRYEFVDQDAFAEDAHASTLRIRLNYETGVWRAWSGLIELDHIAEIIADDFNSGEGNTPSRSQYPVVADPTGTDVNQLYFQYAPAEEWQLRLGRQRITLDNHRFVGNVVWRQNPQTFDALSLTYTGIERTRLFYSFVANANRIFGNEVPAGDHRQQTHLLHGNYTLNEQWSFTGYAYLIDNDDAPAFSSNTLGGFAIGKLPFGEGELSFRGELATQTDAGNAPVSYDANYARIELGWTTKAGWSLGAGVESLGGDETAAGEAFRTPLATLHPMNGWADQFLTTPDAGLDDVFVSIGYTYAAWKMSLIYHDFSAESGSADFGTEFDAVATRPFGERYGLTLKLARFDADAPGFTDTTKLWAMLSASF